MKRLVMVIVVVLTGCGPVLPVAGDTCDSTKDADVCTATGELTGCRSGTWKKQPCAACRAGQPLTNCNPGNGTCSCD